MFVEVLRFRIPLDQQTAFIQADAEIWTTVLSRCPGFARKEVWGNTDDPEELSLVIHWASREQWKSIPLSLLEQTEQQFWQALGKTYPMVTSLEYRVLAKSG